MADLDERLRRWRLALGDPPDFQGPSLSERDARMNRALTELYGDGEASGGRKRGGLGSSAPKVARWLGDIRQLFPTAVVQIVQRDAMERHGLKRLLLEPELLQAVEADVHLVADLISLGSVMPEESKSIARQLVQKVVDELMATFAPRTRDAVRGVINRAKRTSRPRPQDIDWPRTIQRNLSRYIPEHRTVIPERLVGYARGQRHMEEIVLVVDQSGSMAPSVVYASIFSAVLASMPSVNTQLVCFDTAIVDLTEKLEDPVDVLFGVQLGGGTDIHRALTYAAERVSRPTKTHMVLISDLYEGGDAEGMLAKAGELVGMGVNLIVLLALSDEGAPAYDSQHAAAFAALGCPVFACTPDQFPALMATALGKGDVAQWAGREDIALVQG